MERDRIPAVKHGEFIVSARFEDPRGGKVRCNLINGAVEKKGLLARRREVEEREGRCAASERETGSVGMAAAPAAIEIYFVFIGDWPILRARLGFCACQKWKSAAVFRPGKNDSTPANVRLSFPP